MSRTGLLWTIMTLLTVLLVISAAWPWFSPDRSAVGTDSPKFEARSEGDRRSEILRQLTKVFIARGADVSPAVRSGLELAPVPFLNEELSRQGAKWRVGSINDGEVAFVDIS